MKKKTDFDWLINLAITHPVETIIVSIILIIILLIVFRHFHIKNKYSPEAWKIVKKNGRKSIFWYDEDGNETYKKPKIKKQ